jgi:hypothetical protein
MTLTGEIWVTLDTRRVNGGRRLRRSGQHVADRHQRRGVRWTVLPQTGLS